MKLFILAFLSVVLAVKSESVSSKTITDQKNENSAFLQKFLPPLNHNVNQRYGMNYGLNAELIKDILRNDHYKYYDYVDDDEDDLTHNGRSRLYNAPNIWGYSRNGGLGNLVSHSYNGDANVWGYLRNSEGRMRNSEEGRKMNEPIMGNRNIGRIYLIPRTQAHINMMGPENNVGYGNNMGYRNNMGNGNNLGIGNNVGYGNNMGNGNNLGIGNNMGYGNNMGHGNNLGYGNNMGYGNMGIGNLRLDNTLQNIRALLEPDHIGYVGQVHQRGRGHKARHNFAMVGSKELDVDRRRAMAHGRQMTHSLLIDRRINMPYH